MANSRRSLSKQQLQRHKAASQDKKAAAFIPYTRHITPNSIRLKDGSLMAVIRLQGLSFETLDALDLQAFKDNLALFWQTIAAENLGIYYHILRRPHSTAQTNRFENTFCQNLDDTWQERLDAQALFTNGHYITVLMKPPLMQRKLWQKAAHHNDDALKSDLENILNAATNALKSYQPEILTVDDAGISQPLTFLHYLINLQYQPVRLLQAGIDQYLSTSRLLFGGDTFESRAASKAATQFGGIVSLKEYPGATMAGMLNNILRLPQPMVITQSFRFNSRQSSLNAMKLTSRRMASMDDAAVSLYEQLQEGMDDVASGRVVFGYHHLTITTHASSTEKLDTYIATLTGCMSDNGLLAVREDLNMEAAFWATLPGNFNYIARKAEISSHNFAGLASFHTFPTGKAVNHWGAPVTTLATTSGTPYRFSFHDKDIGNFTVIGPTGSGKTLLLLFLLAQAQRYHPRTVYFDKDRGAELALRAMGGTYEVITPNKASGMNPLQLPDTPENKDFLRDWFAALLMPASGTLTAAEKAIIAECVDTNYTLPQKNRQLSVLHTTFMGHAREHADSLSARLKPWWGDGARAWLFDNETDTLSFENPTVGLDMTHILENATCRTPWLMYVFHRIDALLDGQKTIIMLDEGWKLLDDPIFAKRIKDWEKTIRKRNGVLGFATQSAKDAVGSHAGQAIIEQSPTQIFMPNHKADSDAHLNGFGLSQKELEIIRTLDPSSRCFLLKHGTESVIARLDLDGMDDEIAVLSGRSSTVALAETIRAQHGNNPEQWLPHFHEQRKAA